MQQGYLCFPRSQTPVLGDLESDSTFSGVASRPRNPVNAGNGKPSYRHKLNAKADESRCSNGCLSDRFHLRREPGCTEQVSTGHKAQLCFFPPGGLSKLHRNLPAFAFEKLTTASQGHCRAIAASENAERRSVVL